MHGLDQVVVNRRRHLGAVERGRERALVAARLGKEAQLLELSVQRRGHRVLKLSQPRVVGPERALAQHAVCALEQRDKGAAGNGVMLALRVHGLGEAEVGVGEDAADVVRRLGHLPGGGKQPLLGGREDVGGAAADLVEAAPIGLELRLRDIEEVEPVLLERHDLGRGEGRGRGGRDHQAHGPAAEVLVFRLAGVLIALAAGIAVEPAEAQLDLVAETQPAKQGLGVVAEVTAEGGELLRQGLERLVLGEPGLVALKEILQVPRELLGRLGPTGIIDCHSYLPMSWYSALILSQLSPSRKEGCAFRIVLAFLPFRVYNICL